MVYKGTTSIQLSKCPCKRITWPTRFTLLAFWTPISKFLNPRMSNLQQLCSPSVFYLDVLDRVLFFVLSMVCNKNVVTESFTVTCSPIYLPPNVTTLLHGGGTTELLKKRWCGRESLMKRGLRTSFICGNNATAPLKYADHHDNM